MKPNPLAAQAYQYYISKGYPPAAAAGLVGNFVQESGVNPNVRPGDNGTAHGVAQWRGDRWAGLQSYARQNNLNPNDLNTHLGYADYEMRTRYPGVFNRLMSARNVRDATAAVALGYERPRGAQTGIAENVDGWGNRLQHALALAQNGQTGGATPTAVASIATPGAETPQLDIAPPPAPDAEPDDPEMSYAMAGEEGSPGYDQTDLSALHQPMNAEFEMTDPSGGAGQSIHQKAAMRKQKVAELTTPLGQLFNEQVVGMAGKGRA